MSIFNIRHVCGLRAVGIFAAVGVSLFLPGQEASVAADAGDSTETTRSDKLGVIMLNGWPLQRVLDHLGRKSGRFNIKLNVADPEVEAELARKSVTIELRGVTWRAALEYLATKERLLINRSKEADGIIYLEKPPRVTLDIRDEDIRTVIKLIAQDAGQNIIIGPEVTGRVSFNLTDTPWVDALDAILKANRFVKVVEPSGIIRITTADQVAQNMEVRSIRLRYIQPGGNYYEARIGADGVSSDFVTRRGASNASGPLDQSLINALNTVKSPDGVVTYESVTNMLIMRDTPTRLEDMEKMIAKIDRAPRQVKIETRVITDRSNPTERFGVNWTSGLTASVTGGQHSVAFPFGTRGNSDGRGSFGLDLGGILSPATGSTSGPVRISPRNPVAAVAGAYTLGVLDYTSLTAVLEALARKTDTKIVQAPEIIALDNQEATVFIGSVRRYALLQSEATDFGSTQTIEERQLRVGMQLLVVPHICGDTDNVIIEIVPKEEEQPIFQDVNVGGQAVTLPVRSDVKVAHTKMMLKSSETGVIAGLLKREKTEVLTRIPIVSRLPIVGQLFKHRNLDKSVENTIIMVTPWIINENHSGDFNKEVEKIRDQVDSETLDKALNS